MITIPKTDFPIYSIVIIASVIVGLVYIYLSIKKEKEYNNVVLLYFLLAFLSIFIFGKLYTIVMNSFNQSIINVGLSSYGGVIGVILSSIIFEKIMPLKGNLIKFSILSLPLIYGLSKIGCFLAGCCYGIPYNGILSITYTDELNISLFPVQIVETITFIIIFILCNKFKDNRQIVWITIISSAFAKFVLDFLRYEHITKIITTNQVISVALIIVSIFVMLYKKNSSI